MLIAGIVGIIVYICIDLFNNSDQKSDSNDTEYTKGTNDVILDDDYNTNYEKNNIIDLDNLKADGNIKVNKNIFTINSGGDYYITGTNDAQIIIDSNDENIVHLIIENISLNYEYSPIYIKNAEKVIITVIGENSISDTTNYDTEEADATIYSKDDLVINGNGTLNVNGNYKDGIVSKDGLKILNTNITVKSIEDSIKGKDFVYLEDTNIDITSGEDGIQSNNAEDVTLGFITIKGGTYNINSETDGIQAETTLYIESGIFDITTGGGSKVSSSSSNNWGVCGNTEDSSSAKGLKAVTTIIIDNGSFNFDTSDDSIHCNDEITIKNGTYNISSGDDGIHADKTLNIQNGEINITKSYEGLEASFININDGNININSTDDGINAAGGDGSATNRPGGNKFSSSTGTLTINGGNIVVNSDGDGLDANGSIYINGGNTIVYGPTNSGNGALDYDGTLEITDGTLIAFGASGMAQMPSDNSSINSIMINFNQTINSNQIVNIKNSNNEEILNYQANKSYNNLVVASKDLIYGTYTIYIDNEEYSTFNISTTTTKIGSSSNTMMPNDNNMMPRDDKRMPR